MDCRIDKSGVGEGGPCLKVGGTSPMFSQGINPIRHDKHLNVTIRIVPKVDFLAVLSETIQYSRKCSQKVISIFRGFFASGIFKKGYFKLDVLT